MDWQWWCIILSLSASVRSFECPEGLGCKNCQRYPENIYEMDCSTGQDVIVKVEIRSKDYVKLTCTNTTNWTEFQLGSMQPVQDVKTLSFNMCNLPEKNGLSTIAKQLLRDDVEILYFRSYKNLSSALTRETLQGLNSVRNMTLSSNNFTILPEDLLRDFGNLTFLNMRDNNLRELPKNFFEGLKDLKIIEMSTNKLEMLDPSTFGKLERLIFLNLWDNNIMKILPKTFDELVSLESISLQRNNLRDLPSGLFSRLVNLKIINLSQNNFTLGSLPSDLLTNCTNLQSFVLMENFRNMTTLPMGFFANLTNLQSVKLRKIGLISLPEDLLHGATKIRDLSIERNYLATLPSRIFKDNKELVNLDLNFNDLSSLPDDVFTNLDKLETLDLSRNRLAIISEKLFSDLVSLRKLNMERNNMISIHPHALVPLQKLRVARFSHNSLTLKSSNNTYGSPFRSAKEIEELYLDHNNISDIFEDWMFVMIMIRVLDLSYNKIESLTDMKLQFLSDGLKVDLTHNEIRQINLDTVEAWATDRRVSSNVVVLVDDNPIQCDCKLYNLLRYREGLLHPNVHNAFQIDIQNLRCTSPNELLDIEIAKLKSQTWQCDAELSEYNIKCPSQCKCKLRPANKAYIVNCANVGLTEAPTTLDSPIGHTIELNLSRNSLLAMPKFDQPGYEKVTLLAMDHNNISKVSVDNLSPNLRILRLNNNGLSRVDEEVINFLTNSTRLEDLSLDSNPWFCDCEAREFLSFIQKKSASLPNLSEVTCPGKETPLFKMIPEELCPSKTGWIIGGCLTIAFLGIIVGLVAVLYYRYRREVKVWLYAKNLCLWFVTEDELDKDKLFDAFISYSHKDEDFVVNDLVANLEAGPRPFKLCLHFRDWLAGEWIPKQIARSVEDSRRTIVVLSPNFLESVWGRMEFRAAHSQALSEGRARVIVILYGEIGPTDDLDPELKAYLSMNTYVKWGDPWFWQKLKYAMPHPFELTRRKERRSIYETTQPRIETTNDKSELINPPGLPPTPPVTTTPPTESVKFFTINGIRNNENDKSNVNDMNKINQASLPIVIDNCNTNKSSVTINRIQCTRV